MLNLHSQNSEAQFARLRIMKDFKGLRTLPPTCEVIQPDLSDLSHFTVSISPDEGFHKGGKFLFSIAVPSDYPISPPKIKCLQTIYHPNINLDGNVCLNILRDDWKPVLDLSTVILGLVFLFLQPNPDDPLNQEAAAMLKSDADKFQKIVTKTMGGASLDNVQYTNVLV